MAYSMAVSYPLRIIISIYLHLYRYSNVKDNWTQVANLQQGRYGASASILNGKIYVSGGRSNTSLLSSVERFDPAKNQWEWVVSMNVARWCHSSCIINGTIYVAGGEGVNENWLASIEKYDEQLDKWITVRRIYIYIYTITIPNTKY